MLLSQGGIGPKTDMSMELNRLQKYIYIYMDNRFFYKDAEVIKQRKNNLFYK